ncbi:hypothetical membrane protein [Cuniculiplasma divulgatum]|uniref:Hypothetical membrane protein n=1 Tax=Cuniculiplasma divulgatum TaxID=1673428 RepID=A0A1R4A4R4_9ARCH|nr:hypothetical membrane protein [Cuniculiplasma divulgatum]
MSFAYSRNLEILTLHLCASSNNSSWTLKFSFPCMCMHTFKKGLNDTMLNRDLYHFFVGIFPMAVNHTFFVPLFPYKQIYNYS